MDYLFLIKFSTRDVVLPDAVTFFQNLNVEHPDVEIPYVESVGQPKGVVAVISFADDVDPNQVEAICEEVRDYVARINGLIFDVVTGNVLTDSNNNVVVDNVRKLVLGGPDLARWAHAPMANVITGLGSYSNSFDPDSENNTYQINTLKGGAGGKH